MFENVIKMFLMLSHVFSQYVHKLKTMKIASKGDTCNDDTTLKTWSHSKKNNMPNVNLLNTENELGPVNIV